MDLLIISLAGIGDTLFATPLIHELRANFADATIDALVMYPGSKDLLEGNPHLNTIHQKNLIRCSNFERLKYLSTLRKRDYHASLNTHPQSKLEYRIVARLVNASLRISHGYGNSALLDPLLVNRSLPQDYSKHSIENNLALLQFVDAKPKLPKHEYEIHLSTAELVWADEFVSSKGISGRKVLGIHVGSGGTKNLALRRWPLNSYLELIQRLNREQPELAILLFGGPEEEKDHATLMAATKPDRVFFPKTPNFRHAAALLQKCHVFLSVDTVMMHMAAAMKVPRQIVIETPTWNKPIEPYRDSFVLVKNPALKGNNLDYYRYDGRGIRGSREDIIQSMAAVSVEDVFHAITPT